MSILIALSLRGFLYVSFCLLLLSCQKGQSQETSQLLEPSFDFNQESFKNFISEQQLDIYAQILATPQHFLKLCASLIEEGQPALTRLVDKQHPLPKDYIPPDLVNLDSKKLTLAREGLKLRRILLPDLQRMVTAAAQQDIRLPIASSYRSYNYQSDVFRRYTKRDGIDEANRYSARAGQSQHQLGLAIDFAPISQTFAQTPASKWLVKHALDYGFSLSYPQGEEAYTGYIYEPWHYRYVGPIAAKILTRYFQGYQQVFLLFWHKDKLQKHYTGATSLNS